MGNLDSLLSERQRGHRLSAQELSFAQQELVEDAQRAPAAPLQWTIAEASLRARPTVFSALEAEVLHDDYRATSSARCAALEYARMSLASERISNPVLFEFIIGRCGGSIVQANNFNAVVFSGRRPTEASVFADEGERALQGLRANGAPRRGSFGIASTHDRARVAAAMVVVGEELLHLESAAPLVAVDGFVTLEATMLTQPVGVRARVAQGPAAIVACEVTRTDDHLSVRCPYEASDASEVIEIVALDEAGRPVDGRDEFLALRDAGATRAFTTRLPTSTAGTLAIETAARINAVRTAMGVAALTLVPEQSSTNAQLATLYFADPAGDARALAQATAGWEVPVTLAAGESMADEAPLGMTAEELAAHLLQSPIDHEMLLRPDVTHMALGMRFGHMAIQSLTSVYRPFPASDPASDQARLVALAQAERSQAGLPPLTVVPMPEPLGRALQQMVAGEDGNRAFEAASQALGLVAASTDFTVYTLGDLAPDRLLENPAGGAFIAFAVLPFRPSGASRGAYLVFVLRSETATP